MGRAQPGPSRCRSGRLVVIAMLKASGEAERSASSVNGLKPTMRGELNPAGPHP